jgi:ABC-type transporter Mla MlaB component
MAKDTITFEEQLTINNVNEYWSQIKNVLNTKKELELDYSKITKIDGAGLQFIAQLKNIKEEGSKVINEIESEYLSKSYLRYGLTKIQEEQ